MGAYGERYFSPAKAQSRDPKLLSYTTNIYTHGLDSPAT